MDPVSGVLGGINTLMGIASTVTPLIINAIKNRKSEWDNLQIHERNEFVKKIFDDGFSGKYKNNYRKTIEFCILSLTEQKNGKANIFNSLSQFLETYPSYQKDFNKREVEYLIKYNTSKAFNTTKIAQIIFVIAVILIIILTIYILNKSKK